jgi:tumor protein p53-inducible protein 3
MLSKKRFYYASLFRFVCVNKLHLLEVPKSLASTPEQAAAIPEVWLTAFQLLVTIARVRPGDRVLIHAAASGVGTSLI